MKFFIQTISIMIVVSLYSIVKGQQSPYESFGHHSTIHYAIHDLSYEIKEYRFGFNGMEKDIDIKTTTSLSNFGARIQDPRLGIWLSIDPATKDFESYSSYNFALNNPIKLFDPNGEAPFDDYYATIGGQIVFLGSDGSSTNEMRFVHAKEVTTFLQVMRRNQHKGNLLTKASAKDTQLLTSERISKKITIKGNESRDITTLLNEGGGLQPTSIETVLERGATFYFDPQSAQLGMVIGEKSRGNQQMHVSLEDNEVKLKLKNPNVLIFGDIHTHGLADYFEAKGDTERARRGRDPNIQALGDGVGAVMGKRVVYSIDSRVILKHTPLFQPNAFRKGAKPTSTKLMQKASQVLNGTFSLLKDAFETTAGKK